MNDPKVNDRRVRNNLVEIWTGSEWVVQPHPLKSGQHPLTDEIIEEIEMRAGGPCERCSNDMNMRAAYDLAIEHAVDWLECNAVICDDDEGYIYLKEDCFSETSINVDLLVADFKKALRPQKDSQ